MVREAGLPAVLVEAFSEAPLGGNGAAVVLLREPAPTAWMQRVAGSLKQSETAFLLPRRDGTWALRWFTPSREVPLCGHATLASLLALAHWGQVAPGVATRFHSRSGPLTVRLLSPSDSGRQAPPQGQLELPSFPLNPLDPSLCADLITWLSARPGMAPEACWGSALGYQVVLLSPTAPLAGLRGVAASLPQGSRDGLVLMQPFSSSAESSAPGDADALRPAPVVAGMAPDYQLRFFAPGLGLEEDPVTGSAHALVAPYWLERLQCARVVGWQCSDRPGGMVCEAGSSGMIRLTGCGNLLWEGTLQVGPRPGGEDERAGERAFSASAREWDAACGP
jgi:predicted PhzF superfamily epimerase YddE/YHI9